MYRHRAIDVLSHSVLELLSLRSLAKIIAQQISLVVSGAEPCHQLISGSILLSLEDLPWPSCHRIYTDHEQECHLL
jgi:hypothetical protein